MLIDEAAENVAATVQILSLTLSNEIIGSHINPFMHGSGWGGGLSAKNLVLSPLTGLLFLFEVGRGHG